MSAAKPAIVALGKYQIRGVLGRGAMGTVYDGWDPAIGRRVAIKTVHTLDHDDPEAQEGLARFRNEAQAAGRLSHPNIVAVYDYGESDETAYIVMEFIEGTSLKQRLDAKEPFPVAEGVRIMEQVLAGLQFSHDKGVIHRDIKPGNVMMTPDGHAKLADFGIARIESSVMTQAGTLLGTPAYMSPEQLMAQTVDARTDIYSSGVVLYQLLTGERPFEGGLTAIIHKALNTTPPLPSELSVTAPPGLDAVVARAMARRPDDRYPNATAFARAMREAFEAPENGLASLGLGLDDEATMLASPLRPVVPQALAPKPAQPVLPAAQRSRNPALLGGAAVVLCGLIGGGAWFALRPTPSKQPVTPAASPAPSSAPNSTAPATTAPASTASTTTAPTSTSSATTTPASTASAVTGAASTSPAPTGTASPATASTTPAPPASNPPAASDQVTTPQQAPPPIEAPPPNPPAETQAATNTIPQPMPPSNPQSDRVATPAVDVGAIRDALGALAVSAPCALPRFAVADDGVIRVSGLVGAGGPDGALREAVHAAAPEDSLSWGIRGIVGPYCDVFDTVRPIVLPGTPVLGLALKDKPVEATRLRAHEFILPIVSLPAFPAYLQVDYFSHDGSVAHLFPVRGGGRIPFGNNAIVKLGLDPRGKPNLEVGAPFGTDLIVAIASSVPLFPPGQERNDETVQTYLPALKAAIEAAKRVNATLTARPLIVDTVDR